MKQKICWQISKKNHCRSASKMFFLTDLVVKKIADRSQAIFFSPDLQTFFKTSKKFPFKICTQCMLFHETVASTCCTRTCGAYQPRIAEAAEGSRTSFGLRIFEFIANAMLIRNWWFEPLERLTESGN